LPVEITTSVVANGYSHASAVHRDDGHERTVTRATHSAHPTCRLGMAA
jgi:hypothetical protein